LQEAGFAISLIFLLDTRSLFGNSGASSFSSGFGQQQQPQQQTNLFGGGAASGGFNAFSKPATGKPHNGLVTM